MPAVSASVSNVPSGSALTSKVGGGGMPRKRFGLGGYFRTGSALRLAVSRQGRPRGRAMSVPDRGLHQIGGFRPGRIGAVWARALDAFALCLPVTALQRPRWPLACACPRNLDVGHQCLRRLERLRSRRGDLSDRWRIALRLRHGLAVSSNSFLSSNRVRS